MYIGLETKICEFLNFQITTHELISTIGLLWHWPKWDIFETFKNMIFFSKIVKKIVVEISIMNSSIIKKVSNVAIYSL
jgi:hypothetical protein